MKLSQMDEELKNLLEQTAIEANNDSFTHLTTCETIKRWSIKPNHQTDFWKGYCLLVNQDVKLCLSERALPTMPIIVQLKLKFSIDENDDFKSLYRSDFLAHLVHIYQMVIIDTIKIDNQEALIELIVSVLESESYYYEVDPTTKQRYLTTDIRLHFPFVRVVVGFQKRTIRSRAIKLLNDTNAINKLAKRPIGEWNQIISDDFDSPITMFGSTENPNQPKLKLSHNWHCITKEMIDNDSDIDELPKEDIFFPSNHKDVQNNIIEEHVFDENDDVEFWLPVCFALDYWENVSDIKVDDGGRFAKEPKQNAFNFSSKINWASAPTEESTLETCERNITMLNKERFFEEPSWLDIGKSLSNSTKGREAGFLSWLKHTENVLKSSNKDTPNFMTISKDIKTTMKALYRTFAGKPITYKTMGHYARIDSPDEYATWHREWCSHPISKALNCSHMDVANAIYKVYWLDFLYCPITKRWFIFKEGRWELDIDALDVIGYIAGDFIRRLENMKKEIRDTISDSNDDDEKENGNATILKIDALIMKLKHGPFLSNIVTALKTKFKDSKFERTCDSNPNMLGVANGILEVIGGNIHFRAAKPEDYVLMNTKIEYDDSFTWDSPQVVACMAWMSQVFPDPKLKLHFLKFAASCIKGRNSDKIFPIFTGEGNNSKSMIVKLFMQTFGEYAIKFDMANVTGRNNNPGAASPHTARAKSVRLGFMDEAADDVPMHKETIKRVVGGDSFYTRKLHDNGGDIEVFFKLVLSCNKVPIIPKADTAIKNRVKIFPFLGTWTSDPAKLKEPNTYEMKENFEDDIPYMVSAFLWILVQHFPIYNTEKLKDPEIVTKHTKDYWENNDVYAQFAADCIHVSESNDAKVSFVDVYSRFRIWWKDSFDGVKVPEKPLIKRDMQARWGHLVGKFFLGISLIEDEFKREPPVTKAEIKQEAKVEIPLAQPPKDVPLEDLAEANLKTIKEMISLPKTPEAIRQVRDHTEKAKKDKDIQETMGDISTKLWSPGIMAGVSGEINFEDDGAIDI
jgi:phage/plasmid-associated DNA primase